LPSAVHFTSPKSRDGDSAEKRHTKKATPSKPKLVVQPNRLKVVQEERMETQDSGQDANLDLKVMTQDSQQLSPRTRIIAKIQKQIRISFLKTGQPPETQVEWYKIGKVMGKGAFGKVNLAIHRLSSKFVALKSINKSVMKNDASKRKVMQEFNILRHTRHCNIVRLYESFETV
jgi:serine/threonine protein kinase